MSGIFSISWKDVLDAVATAIVIAVLSFIVTLTDIYTVSLHQIVNIAVLAGAASLLKALLTTRSGNFMGALPVK